MSKHRRPSLRHVSTDVENAILEIIAKAGQDGLSAQNIWNRLDSSLIGSLTQHQVWGTLGSIDKDKPKRRIINRRGLWYASEFAPPQDVANAKKCNRKPLPNSRA